MARFVDIVSSALPRVTKGSPRASGQAHPHETRSSDCNMRQGYGTEEEKGLKRHAGGGFVWTAVDQCFEKPSWRSVTVAPLVAVKDHLFSFLPIL